MKIYENNITGEKHAPFLAISIGSRSHPIGTRFYSTNVRIRLSFYRATFPNTFIYYYVFSNVDDIICGKTPQYVHVGIIIHKRDDGYCDAPSDLSLDVTLLFYDVARLTDWTWWKSNQSNQRSFE